MLWSLPHHTRTDGGKPCGPSLDQRGPNQSGVTRPSNSLAQAVHRRCSEGKPAQRREPFMRLAYATRRTAPNSGFTGSESSSITTPSLPRLVAWKTGCGTPSRTPRWNASGCGRAQRRHLERGRGEKEWRGEGVRKERGKETVGGGRGVRERGLSTNKHDRIVIAARVILDGGLWKP